MGATGGVEAAGRPGGLRGRLLGLPSLDPSRPGARSAWLRRLALVAAVGLVVAGALVWGLARLVDGDVVAATVRSLAGRPELWAVVVSTYFGAFALRTVAWARLLPARSRHPRYSRLLGIVHLALLANHLLPAKPGDVLRGYLLYRDGVPAADAGVTTVVARLLDLAALAVIAAVLTPVVLADWLRPVAPVAAAALAIGFGAVAVLLRHRTGWVGWLPGPAARLVASVAEALRSIPPRRTAGAFIAFVLPSWVLEAGVLLAVSEAAGLDLSVAATVAITAFTILVQSVQVTPGNLGVYEATMAGALAAHGVDGGTALAVAAVTHAVKFAYSYAAGAIVLGGTATGRLIELVRRRRPEAASRVEIVAARLWNVLNEGKPFTVVFSVGTFLAVQALVGIPGVSWDRVPVALLAAVPLAVVLYRFDFPLRLRWGLWGLAAGFLAWFQFASPELAAWLLAAYLGFTVILWGSVYYHLRIGTPLTNFTRFWRLVLENPDTTSANFLEQVPKCLLLTHAIAYAARPSAGPGALPSLVAFAAVAGASALLLHRWRFTWRPALPVRPRPSPRPEPPLARRFLLIVIDGCRTDRLAEARTPVLDRLAAEGLSCSRMETVYPARTVTGFGSMLTGAPPDAHGMRSNFVPRLGIRCESVFDVLREEGRRGRLVGIAHLVDAFGPDVRAVSAVRDNDEIDRTLLEAAKDEIVRGHPDLLVLQLLSVDQTGHARGSYREEYLARIEATDALIGELLDWLDARGDLDGTSVAVTSDHGQGRGVGGHGHLSRGEREVPFILWGAGAPTGVVVDDVRSLIDVTPTICRFLGIRRPDRSSGRPVTEPHPRAGASPLAVLIPALDEEASLPGVLAAIPDGLGDVRVIVVDDGSHDATADVARAAGATVVRHPRRRGLGAALRTGLVAAHALDPWAVVYLDGDGEYDPADIPAVLEPIRTGRADYVLGNRFAGSVDGMRRSRRVANQVFTALVAALSGRRVRDGQTGMRAFSARALAAAEIVHDYNYAQVLTLDLLAKGFRLEEVPISYRFRRHGSSFVTARYLWRVPLGMAREVLRD